MIVKDVLRKVVTVMMLTAFAVFAAGLASVPAAQAQLPDKIRIGIITTNNYSAYKNAGAINFSVRGTYQIIDTTAFPGLDDVIGTPAEGENWQVLSLTTGLQVMKDGVSLKVSPGPVVVREVTHGAGNLILFNSYTPSGSAEKVINKKYRGSMEFRTAVGSVTAVNELPVEEYLNGVVTKEMSSGWPLEALKAQATVARSYAIVNINKHVNEGYNLCDGTHCQAYGGFGVEAADGVAAVDGTKGQVIILPAGSKPLSALYHASSGGHTEDNENVWSGSPLSYLRGKEDPYSLNIGTANWTYITTLADIGSKLRSFDSNFSQVSTIKLEKYPSGRVKKVIATDINGYTVTRTGSEFGKLFNPTFAPVRDTQNKYVSFMSNFFNVDLSSQSQPAITVENGAGQKSTLTELGGLVAVAFDRTIGTLNGENSTYYVQTADGLTAETKYPTGAVTFNGHGWGHGVGMSQWGAYQMAKQGKSYREILTFYYTGVEIVNY